VTKAVDLPYSGNQRLDVYAPAATGRWPVVVVLHAGGGTKEVMSDLAEAIAGRGAVVFIPTYYSLPTREAWQGAVQVACAMRYARAQASRYGGDGARVMLVGYSAGGGFGALMLLAGDDLHGDCLTQEGSALPDAFVGLDGAYDLLHFVPTEELRAKPAEWRRISPFTYVDRQPLRTGVPILFLVGEFTDARQHAQAFRDALQSAGYAVWIESVPGVDHDGMASPLPQTVGDIHDLLGP
jgi:acetyl esterase/lipase